ncbi:MAG: pitrilysin family protein, partial [Alphaproteobacteria bacterium]|nr:pitrilysin family protein [Alphaproteobacteria bacterium]
MALFLLLPAFSSAARAQLFNPEYFVLDNGLEVVVLENHRAPIVSHMVWYKVGGADEPPGKSGLAHFFEHLMFMGTEKYPAGEFSDIVARNGGRENAFTSQDYTGYFQNVAADRLELMMELESDRMRGLILTAEVIEPERLVIIEERRQRVERTPQGLLGEQVSAATFANHPYRVPVIGWEDEIRTLTLDDLKTFYDTWYAPNNAVLIVAGDVEVDEVRRMAATYYGPIAARNVPERIRPAEPVHQAPREVVLTDARVPQPSWTRRYLAPSYKSGDTQHSYPLQVLSQILGGGTTSRLYRELVIEQGLAVAAGSSYSAGVLDLAIF